MNAGTLADGCGGGIYIYWAKSRPHRRKTIWRAGKSGAQIFANDCALCHKTPQAVLKGGAPGEGFLRQHYTSSRESAASVAAYLRGIRAPVSAGGGSK